MPHQRSYRLGWQSQNMARFILYKFCFLAEPVQIADDIGIDFFCTLFETEPNKKNTSLIPRNSFAIQIKSKNKSNKVQLTDYLPYLARLELPFFIGIVDRSRSAMTLYSGEYLIPFFAYKGIPDRLEAKLCEKSDIANLTHAFGWLTKTRNGKYIVLFPKITEITVQMDEGEHLNSKVNQVQEICSMVLENIASKTNYQFIFGSRPPYNQLLFAGPASLERVELNLFSRLAEVFYNLNWVYSNSAEESKPQIRASFRIYENIYLQLVSFYTMDNLPDSLKSTFKGAKERIG